MVNYCCWEVWGITAGRIGVRSMGHCAGFTAEADRPPKSGQNFKGSHLRFFFLRRIKQKPTSQQTNKQTNKQNTTTNNQTKQQQNTTKTERRKEEKHTKKTNKQKTQDLLYDFKDLFQ